MRMEFWKMEGIGNDFVMIDDRDLVIQNKISYNELSKKVCNRNFGIGGDGLIVVNNSESHDIKFRIFNPDGTEPEMCGNGIRCYAKFVYDKKIISKKMFNVETLAGTIIPSVNVNENNLVETVRVDMGIPVLNAKSIPYISDKEEVISEKIKVDNKEFEITPVSMGNPHGVIFVDEITDELVKEIGPKLEIYEKFPEKANIEFIKVISDAEMNMRVWERGAGETLACGTGASASLVAAVLNNKTNNKVLIHLLGGDLEIEWNLDTKHVFKTGPATLAFEGNIEI